MSSLVEQIDRRLIALYFEEGIKVVRGRWLEGDECRLFLKYGQGIKYENQGRRGYDGYYESDNE